MSEGLFLKFFVLVVKSKENFIALSVYVNYMLVADDVVVIVSEIC